MMWREVTPEEAAPYLRAVESVGGQWLGDGARVRFSAGPEFEIALWGDIDADDPARQSASLPEGLDGLSHRQAGPFRLILTPSVDAATGRRLQRRGVAYVDAAGNAHVAGTGLFIHVEGRRRRPQRRVTSRSRRVAGGSLGRLATPGALKVTFALLIRPELRTAALRDVASAAKVSVATAHGAVGALRGEGYLRANMRSDRALGRRAELTRLWAVGYGARLVPTLESAYATTQDLVADLRLRLLSEGSCTLAGESMLPTLRNGAGLVVFEPPPWRHSVRAGRLSLTAEPTQVVLRERFWEEESLAVGVSAPAILTAAELLLSADPRAREAGEDLLIAEGRHD